MATVTTREELREYCFRNLGKPTVDINVTNQQADDRIDEALQFYRDYHWDGTEKVLRKHVVTTTDISNEYVTIPETMIGVTYVAPVASSYSSGNFFDVRYQLHLNELFNTTSVDVVPYFMAMQYVSQLEEIFVGKNIIRYNRHRDRLHLDMDWSQIVAGEYLLIVGYEVVDPDVYSDVWNDPWLLKYTTQLIKRQWGTNMKKFTGMQLPGGIEFNGQQIYDEAQDAIGILEEELIQNNQMPLNDFIG